MRTIKFRAWDTLEKEMLSFYVLEKQVYNILGHMNSISGSNWIYMQFTGLIDKNGKEIYEGDVVKYIHQNCIPNEERKVKVSLHRIGDGGLYNGVDAYYPFVNTIAGGYKENNRQIADVYLTPPSECEIIGNIYENSDLLE